MRAILMAFALACPLVTTATALGQASSGNDTTVRDGVYSEAQAKRGQATYVDKCSECHDDGLMGPELWGADFLSDWENKNVGALYTLISTTMPADNPGSLKQNEVLDLVAYVLRANGFPPGDKAIESASALDTIRFAGGK
jgi:mono/diheme cytochrome c family protein